MTVWPVIFRLTFQPHFKPSHHIPIFEKMCIHHIRMARHIPSPRGCFNPWLSLWRGSSWPSWARVSHSAWSQGQEVALVTLGSGPNLIPRRVRPGLAELGSYTLHQLFAFQPPLSRVTRPYGSSGVSAYGLQGDLARKKQPSPLGPPYDTRYSPTAGS